MKRKHIIFHSLAMLVLVTATLLLTNYFSNIPLDYVVSSVMDEENIYSINRSANNISLFRSNEDGVYTGRISFRQYEAGEIIYLDNPMIHNGKLYVLCRTADDSLNDLGIAIYYCNFDKRRLDKVIDLSGLCENDDDISLQRMLEDSVVITVQDGNIITDYHVDLQGNVLSDSKWLPACEHEVVSNYWSDNGNNVSVCMDGSVNGLRMTGADGKVISSMPNNQFVNFASDGGNRVYFTSLQNGSLYEYDMSTDTLTESKDFINRVAAAGRPFSDFKHLRFQSMDSFLASCDLDNGASGLGIYRYGQLNVISHMRPAYLNSVVFYLLLAGLVMLTYSLLCLLAYGLYYKYCTFLSIRTKFVVLLVSILLVSMLTISYATQRVLSMLLMQNEYEKLISISNVTRNFIQNMPVTDKNGDIQKQNRQRADLFFQAAKVPSSVENVIDGYDLTETNTTVNHTFCWGYSVGPEGNLQSYYTTEFPRGTPIEYVFHAEVVKQLETVQQDQRLVQSRYDDCQDSWRVIFRPIIVEGKVVGITEYGLSELKAFVDCRDTIRTITFFLWGAFAAALMGILIIVHKLLKSLKRLEIGVEQLADGHLGTTVGVRGHDEISRISKVFNQMSLSTKEIFDQKVMLERAYCRYVPMELLKLLERENITKVVPGDERELDFIIMKVQHDNFESFQKNTTAAEAFGLVNQHMQAALPIFSAHRGVVQNFENGGVTVVFLGQFKELLACAMELGKALNATEKQYTITITKGPATLGIIGDQDRQSIVIASEQEKLNRFLQKSARRYYADILVSEEIAQGFLHLNREVKMRALGYFQNHHEDRQQLIYDVYECDTSERIYNKDNTKLLFEEGVQLFVKNRFYEARRLFVEVLRRDGQDLAAKEYLCLCDRYYKNDSAVQPETFIETF